MASQAAASALVHHQNLRVNPIAEDTIYLSQGHGEIKLATIWELLSMLASFHSAGRFHACYWGEESSVNYPAMNPVSYNNHGPVKISTWCSGGGVL